jgi:DNA transformation protein and related proteins
MAPARGKLRPMASSNSFRAYVIDQLAALRDVRARPMFGGIGLYAGDVFFGLIASDVLYLKVDSGNRARYEAAGCEPFRPYPEKSTAMTMPYYNVPVAVLEDASELVAWARLSVGVGERARDAKRPRTRKLRMRSAAAKAARTKTRKPRRAR